MDVVVGDHGHFVGKDVLEAAGELIQQEKAQIFEGPPIAPGRHPHHDKDYWLRVDTDEGRVWIPLPLKPVFKVGDHVHYYTEDRPTPPYWFGVIQEVHDWSATVEWPARPSPPLRRHAAAHRPPVGQPPARASLITKLSAIIPKVHLATCREVMRAREARSCGTEVLVRASMTAWRPA